MGQRRASSSAEGDPQGSKQAQHGGTGRKDGLLLPAVCDVEAPSCKLGGAARRRASSLTRYRGKAPHTGVRYPTEDVTLGGNQRRDCMLRQDSNHAEGIRT